MEIILELLSHAELNKPTTCRETNIPSNLSSASTISMAVFIAKGSKGSLDTLGKGSHTLSALAGCQKLMLTNIDGS